MEEIITTVSTKGQLVIPAAIRQALGIGAGTRVAIRQEGSRVVIDPETLADLRGQIFFSKIAVSSESGSCAKRAGKTSQ